MFPDGGLLSLLMIHTTSMLLNGFLNVLVLRLIGKKELRKEELRKEEN